MKKYFPCCWFSLLLLGVCPLVGEAQTIDVWIGTGRAGIYHLTLDTKDGILSKPMVVSEAKGAGFLSLHPNGKVLYATTREGGGGVTAFSIDRSADPDIVSDKLSPIGTISTGDGGAACIAVDRSAMALMSAQYGGGSISTYALTDSGSLDRRVQTVEHGAGSKSHPKRQQTAHPHWVGTSPDNRFVMVPDLGKDQVLVYDFDSESGEVKWKSSVDLPAGSGPRHMKFHPSGDYVFVLNELALTLSVFRYDPESGALIPVQEISTLSESLKDKHLNSAAEIRVHPTGRFVYASNRGHDSISVFSFDLESGKLELVERESIRGAWPRNFNLDPSGRWLIAAGQRSNTLALFEVDLETGELVFARQVVNATDPTCVLFQSE